MRTGWNIIGNPFDQPVPWNAVKSDNATSANLWTYNGAGGFQSTTALEPHQGYYFFSNSTSLKIRYPFPAMSIDPGLPPAIDWKIQLLLETESSTDAENYVGIASMAKQEIDELDQPKPPVFAGQPSLILTVPSSELPQRSWSSDFRPGVAEGQVWEFTVANPKHFRGKQLVQGVALGLDISAVRIRHLPALMFTPGTIPEQRRTRAPAEPLDPCQVAA